LDATFFGRGYGILVSRILGKNIHWREIKTENLNEYRILLTDLKTLKFPFSSFAIDGRAGVKKLLKSMFPKLPIQHCQFHQKQTIQKYISKNPKLLASKELAKIVQNLTKSTKKDFEELLFEWHKKWGYFLKEKSTNIETGRKRYTHGKLRSAYFSLKRNLPYLFIYLEFPELKIPNTTNSIDGSFSHWKNKVKLHRGLRQDRRKKMIDVLIFNS
jgi:transposase-like protein